jgi:hypothetical protein
VGEVGDLVGEERAAATAALRPAGHARLVEEAVDDQLAAAVEQVEQAGLAVGAFEPVLLFDRHPRHPAALGGQRISRARELLLLGQQLLVSGLPVLLGDDRRHVHALLPPSSARSSVGRCRTPRFIAESATSPVRCMPVRFEVQKFAPHPGENRSLLAIHSSGGTV